MEISACRRSVEASSAANKMWLQKKQLKEINAIALFRKVFTVQIIDIHISIYCINYEDVQVFGRN